MQINYICLKGEATKVPSTPSLSWTVGAPLTSVCCRGVGQNKRQAVNVMYESMTHSFACSPPALCARDADREFCYGAGVPNVADHKTTAKDGVSKTIH